MPRPILSIESRREEEIKFRCSSAESEEIHRRAKSYGAPVGRFIREVILSDETFRVVSPASQTAARRSREIAELLRRIYFHRANSGANNKNLTTADSQTELDSAPNNLSDEETIVWSQIFDQFNALNAELLDYADCKI